MVIVTWKLICTKLLGSQNYFCEYICIIKSILECEFIDSHKKPGIKNPATVPLSCSHVPFKLTKMLSHLHTVELP